MARRVLTVQVTSMGECEQLLQRNTPAAVGSVVAEKIPCSAPVAEAVSSQALSPTCSGVL